VSKLDLTLLGKWKSDPSDLQTTELYGQVSIEFTDRGEVSYTIHGPDKDQIILLNYRVEGDVLVTDQPSEPRQERTRFFLDSAGRLLLFFGGRKSSYIRETIR
jgi:hypothetical protein